MNLLKDTFDLIVLGAGSGGLAAAKRAASHGARVAIVEGDRVGGTCVIRGCVPKKLLVYGSQYDEYLKDSHYFGIEISRSSIDSSVLLNNVRREVDRLNRLHVELLEKSGVEIISGWGSITSPTSISVISSDKSKKNKEIQARNILIAVGGRPVRPDIPGAALGWVSDDMFLQKNWPEKVVIVGAGFIACEFSCIMNGLGIEVVQLVRGNTLLKGFDQELSLFLEENMRKEGIDLQFQKTLSALEGCQGDLKVLLQCNEAIDCGGVLFATGRKPFLDGLNLDKIGIVQEAERIKVDSGNATNIANIFAIGDVAGHVQLTPVAVEEGRVLADNLFSGTHRKVKYNLIPKAVFSKPEIASIGLSENEALDKFGGGNVQVYRSKFRPMSQSLQKSERRCLLKLVVDVKTDKILGCQMAGEHSAEIIQMASIAISMGATKLDFDQTMALHPTIAEEFVTMR